MTTLFYDSFSEPLENTRDRRLSPSKRLRFIAAPQDCAEKELSEVIRISRFMSKEKSFDCFQFYFQTLGELITNETNSTTALNLNGSYLGNMKWFNGPLLVKCVGNVLWKGLQCDGNNNTCSIITRIIDVPEEDSDIGVVTYKDPCPELDDHPCYIIDFTTGPLPRFYYTRKVTDGVFLSFVHIQDGSDSYSDVNVLTSNN